MMEVALVIPDEPSDLRAQTRALIERTPAEGLACVEHGEWLARPLWAQWQDELQARQLNWDQFLVIVRSYHNEARLWVIGERTWAQCVEGLIGRVMRRLPE